ncbi:hypothetical protein D9M68_969970 [compost metagenome]
MVLQRTLDSAALGILHLPIDCRQMHQQRRDGELGIMQIERFRLGKQSGNGLEHGASVLRGWERSDDVACRGKAGPDLAASPISINGLVTLRRALAPA